MTTLKEEIQALGIEPKNFDKFYKQLTESQQLPANDIIPSEQYTTLVDYLREKQVLDKDNQFQKDGYEIFNSRMFLEDMFHKSSKDSAPQVPLRLYGGFHTCRRLTRGGYHGGRR